MLLGTKSAEELLDSGCPSRIAITLLLYGTD